MSLPGLISITDAMIKAPASADKTAIIADLTQLSSDLQTAVNNGRLDAAAAAVEGETILIDFAQRIAQNMTA
jgi:hypothetical protein